MVFTNPIYNPPTVDRNLRVDSITVNGVTIQSEDPNVFSTGTWQPGIGITPGSWESETLHGDGYFEYYDPGLTNNGSLITIRAAGVTNEEIMALRIDGQSVNSWSNVGGNAYGGQFVTYNFNASESVTADQIQIAFTNDLYIAGVTDRNLRVDWIEIDGQRFETEDPSVFSTGTWQPGGVVPGYNQSEYLHNNGYFQYDPGSVGDPGRFSIQPSPFIPTEDISSITLEVNRLGGSDGAVSVDYYTSDESAIAGQDYVAQSGTLDFADGQDTRTVTINLLNDSIVEGTETFSVILDNPIGTTLLAPRTSTVTIVDDDVVLPNSPSFPNADGINTNGVAWVSNGSLNVTGNVLSQAGHAFYETPIAIDENTSFRSLISILDRRLLRQQWR